VSSLPWSIWEDWLARESTHNGQNEEREDLLPDSPPQGLESKYRNLSKSAMDCRIVFFAYARNSIITGSALNASAAKPFQFASAD
jgi:hypothetical protein